MKEREGAKKLRSKHGAKNRQISSAMGIMKRASIIEMLRGEEIEKENKRKMKAEELENRNKRKAERDIRIQENLETKKAAKDEAVKKKEEDTKKKREEQEAKKLEADKKKEEKKLEQEVKRSQKKAENTKKSQDPIRKCRECSHEFEPFGQGSMLWRSCENCPNWFCPDCCSPELEKCKSC